MFDECDIDKFIEGHNIRGKKYEEYKKAEKLKKLFEGVGMVTILVSFSSLLALFLIPAYSITAKLVLSVVNLPDVLNSYVNGTPGFQTSTLVIVAALGGTSLAVSIVSFKVSSKFRNYAKETGLSSRHPEFQKLAQGYLRFENGNYKEGIELFEQYDGSVMSGHVEQYVSSSRTNGGIDEEYIGETYQDFLCLLIENMGPSVDRRRNMLAIIVNKHDSDYYVEDVDKNPETNDSTRSYIGIMLSVISDVLSSLYSRLTSFGLSRPLVIHVSFLIVGIALIQFNPTLAVIVATVLTGGFESWRRTQIDTEREKHPVE